MSNQSNESNTFGFATIFGNTSTRFTAEYHTTFLAAVFARASTGVDDQPSILSFVEVPDGATDTISDDDLSYTCIGELMKEKTENLPLDIKVDAQKTVVFKLTGYRDIILLNKKEIVESSIPSVANTSNAIASLPGSTVSSNSSEITVHLTSSVGNSNGDINPAVTTHPSQTNTNSFSQPLQTETQTNPATVAISDHTHQTSPTISVARPLGNRSLLDVHREDPQSVVIFDIYQGSGPLVTPTSKVHLKYTGQLLDGTIWARPKLPVLVKLGVDPPIAPGFRTGIQCARQGTRRIMVIPPQLGYGSRGHPNKVPPNSILIIDCEIKQVEN